jgi:hypothetical protein
MNAKAKAVLHRSWAFGHKKASPRCRLSAWPIKENWLAFLNDLEAIDLM